MPGRVREIAEEKGDAANRQGHVPYDGPDGVPEDAGQNQDYTEREPASTTPKPSPHAVPFKNLK